MENKGRKAHSASATGLPNSLKAGIENLSGHSLSHVNVHYNSPRPAQLNAHAYTQGTDIHLGGAQGSHIAHEPWHVRQQMQGRVRPTMDIASQGRSLENQADKVSTRAMHGAIKK